VRGSTASAERSRAGRLEWPAALQSRWALVVALLAIAATGALLVRLPAAAHSFDTQAAFNDRQPPEIRTIAGADGLAIDNEFLLEAIKLVPPHSTFAVEMPATAAEAKPYGIVPTTLAALRPYLQNLLLPSRMVSDPSKAQYLLCYACNTDPFDPRMTRLWQSPKGFVIGRLRR
jgi:hypothetical protein